jgi:nucleotide sugar dehydrogenase
MERSDAAGSAADVCVVGLGYVGLTLAVAFAKAGVRVAGVERIASVVTGLRTGRATFHEDGFTPALGEVLGDGRLTVCAESDPLPAAAAYIITVGTPVRNGSVDLGDLRTALAAVAAGMPDGALVVLRSTVRVGTTDTIAADVLGATGKAFLLAMAPERTAEGQALQELSTLPQLVGGIDYASTAAASALFARLGVEIVELRNSRAAELAKLASNTWRDMQFAFANEMAYLADATGVDIHEVFAAASHRYERFRPALPGPSAGPCLGKDAYVLADSAELFGAGAPLSLAARAVNESIAGHVVALVRAAGRQVRKVSILGLAFQGRPATSDTRGSTASDIAAALHHAFPAAILTGWDPLVVEADARALGVEPVPLAHAMHGTDVVILHTNAETFSGTDFHDTLVTNLPHQAAVIDLWNQSGYLAQRRPDIHLHVLGRAGSGVHG